MNGIVELREVRADDLEAFYEHQIDPDAGRMAAFPARDRAAFMAHWQTKVLPNPTGLVRAILFDGDLTGNIVCWDGGGGHEVGYWIGRDWWGKGIATRALSMFVAMVPYRPLHAHVAMHNVGSVRVLQKCGFHHCGREALPAERGLAPFVELTLRLDAANSSGAATGITVRGRDGYEISTDPQRLDPPAIHAFLTRCYWSTGIPQEVVARALRGSLCFGLYHGGTQVGMARVITDRATFAYLCDVYVLEEHRGRGLGRWLLEVVMAQPDLQGVRRFVLVTRDAHRLYAPAGFQPLARPECFMEIRRPDIYRTPEA